MTASADTACAQAGATAATGRAATDAAIILSTWRERLQRRCGGASLAACAGLDPSPAACALLPRAAPGGSRSRATRAGSIERLCGLLIESSRDHVAVVKPQIAWFEAAGAPGIRALERTIAFARAAGLLVLLDAKRGDVPVTASAYADAWLGSDASSGIGADALTVNPAIGADSLEAMASIAAARHCGLYALLYTSNPGAAELQDAQLADGTAWWLRLASMLERVDSLVGGGVIGAVVGATHDEQLRQVRSVLPDMPLLVPGVGAQGGSLDAVARAATAAAPSLVSASRSLLPPTQAGSTSEFRARSEAAVARHASSVAAASAITTTNG